MTEQDFSDAESRSDTKATNAHGFVWERLLWCSSIVVAAAGVFLLPWYVATNRIVPGESYALGFNNRFAILALGVALLLAVVASRVGTASRQALGWLADPVVPAPQWWDGRKEYLTLCGWAIAWSLVLWGWGTYLVDPAWCEARGFLQALDLMAAGRKPYGDFMFNYGPATLYVPYAISWLTQGDVSFEYAYLFTLIAFTLVGFAALFVVLQALALGHSARWVPLFLGLAGWSQISMGLNGVPLRFLVVPSSLVLVHAAIRARQQAGTSAHLTAFLASGGAMSAATLMSPEMAIAGVAACTVYAFALALAGAVRLAVSCLAGLLFLASLIGVIGPDYFLSVFAFASGGGNFPIYPNAHNVALVAVCMYVIPNMIAAGLRQPRDPRAPLSLALAVAGGMLLPAALGRCDPGHVYFNGLVPFTMMFAVTARRGPFLRRSWWCIYGLLFIVLLQFSYWSYYTNNFIAAMQMRGFYEQNPQLVETWRQKWDALKARHPRGGAFHWSSVLPYPVDLDEFTQQGPMLLTAGNEWNLWLARYLVLQKDLPQDYFHAYSQGAASPAQIERKVRESRAARFLMIPEFVLAPLEGPIDLVAYGKGLDRFLSGLMFFPVQTTVKRQPFFPDSDIAKALLEDFAMVLKYQGYLVVEKKASAMKHGDRDVKRGKEARDP